MSIGVRTCPGATAFTVIRCGPNDRASPRDMVDTPPLVAAYTTDPPKPPVHQPCEAEQDDPATVDPPRSWLDGGPSKEERRLQVHVVLEVPVVLGDIVEARPTAQDRRKTHQAVDAAEGSSLLARADVIRRVGPGHARSRVTRALEAGRRGVEPPPGRGPLQARGRRPPRTPARPPPRSRPPHRSR